jgi:hypothetical protein
MATPRFNDGSQRVISRSAIASYPRWVRVAKLGCVRDPGNFGQKRMFAIVSRPIPSEVKSKTIRRIVIFDTHPDSLRLVLEAGLDAATDDTALRQERRTSIICGSILIAMMVGSLLWALLG